jgi:uncharacterized protein (DUF427 family)
MARAMWNDAVLAESEDTQDLEGNVYFPPGALVEAYLEPSETRTRCPWKGEARFFHVVVGGVRNEDAAWTYPAPQPAASRIKDHVAFWRGVQVEK